MKNPALLLLAASCAWVSPPSAHAAPAGEAKASWTVSADHPDALYKAGEAATFTVTLAEGSAIAPDAELFWKTDKDGFAPVAKGTVKLSGGTGTFTTTLAEPGFLQCRVSDKADGRLASQWGVGFSPEKLQPSLPVPDDFDAFWKGQLDKLAGVPLNPSLTPVADAKNPKVESFDTRVDCIGPKVSGYFSRPAGAKPKSLPAVITLHGAGVRSASLQSAAGWASQGFLAMDINAHGIDNGKDEAFYKALSEGELNNYRAIGRNSRESGYFTGMFLRVKRGLDFLCSQPEWDGKTLIVAGGSQGGFQAFAGAALDERVTIMIAHVPAGCDHTGMLADRIPGWPKMVPVVSGKPDPAVLEASRYVDNVNFAIRCKAETAVVSVGYVDGVCPPTSVYAAYNALPLKDKTIIDVPGMGHTVPDMVYKKARDVVKLRLGK